MLRSTFDALGTTASVVVQEPADLVLARLALEEAVVELDRAASRFREDSEIAVVQLAAGTLVPVGQVLWEALLAADRAVAVTDGLVDPTVGAAMVALSYDRDFAAVDQGLVPAEPHHVPGWRSVVLDRSRRAVCVAAGTVVDLGAVGPALAVDRAAAAAATHCRGPVLLAVGGDGRACGPLPAGGWPVRVGGARLEVIGARSDTGDEPDDPADEPGVALQGGALATSAPGTRRWGAAGAVHHIVDPRTGGPAGEVWAAVTVAAGSCVDANIASTAAVVLGHEAPAWLAARRLPALLQPRHGPAVAVGQWPVEGGVTPTAA